MPLENGLSWKEHLFLNNPITQNRIIDLFMVKSPTQNSSPAPTQKEDVHQLKDNEREDSGTYYIFALCSSKPINNASFASIPRYFDEDEINLNILSFEADKFVLHQEILNFPLPDRIEKRIAKCVVDPKHECIFLFLRSSEEPLIYKFIPKKIDKLSPHDVYTENGTLSFIDLWNNPNNSMSNYHGKTVKKLMLDEDDSWITWVGKTMANGFVYGLVKCISPTSPKYKLDVVWISFNTSTYEIDFLNVKSNVRVSEVFSYENDDIEPPTLVISNGEIFVLNLKHEEYESKIPRLNLSMMQWNNIPYRISHKYRRKQVQSKEEQKAIMSNSTAVAYIGFKYFIVLTRTRVFELFNSGWKIFSDLKELVSWKPFSDRPIMLATNKFLSIFLLNRSMELFEIDITYVQKLLSLHSLEHNMALAFNHPKHTDMIFRIEKSVSPLSNNKKKSVQNEEREYPVSEPTIFTNDEDDNYPVEIKAHSIVIKSRAPEIFKIAVKKDNIYEVVLHDLKKAAAVYALKYIYTNQLDTSISKLTSKEIWDLFTVCQKFSLPKLRDRCLMIQNKKLYQSRKEKGLPSMLLKRNIDEMEIQNQLPSISNNYPSQYFAKLRNANEEYFTQNYDKAIQLYSDTITDSMNFIVRILVKRCAAYEKENQLELALADAEKAFFLCENDKEMKAKIKMRIGYIMNMMNKPLEGFICFCEAHELDPNTSGLFWDSSALQHAGHKLKLEGHPIPEKYKYMHTEVVSELAKSFQPLINDPHDSDFRFYFSKYNKTVYAHQFFIVMAGDFFRTLLQYRQSEVVILTVDNIYSDATVEDILMLLEWIYTRKSAFIYNLPNDRLCSILILSEFFGMYYISNEAQYQLMAKLRTDPISEVIYYISISHSVGLRDVYNDLFDIVSDRLKEVESLDLTQFKNVSPEILKLIETSFQNVSKSADLLKRSLSRDVQHFEKQRRSLSGDIEMDDAILLASPLNTRTLLSQCSVRLFGWSYEDPMDGLCLIDAECSTWGSIWALHNLGTAEHLYQNPHENFAIKFELVIDRVHPKFTLKNVHYSCEIHRNVHSKNTQHPIFKLQVAEGYIIVQLSGNRWEFPYTDSQDVNSEKHINELLESVIVNFDKYNRTVSCNISNRKKIQVNWPTSGYENMTTERRLFMSLTAKNERYFARYSIAEWVVDSGNSDSTLNTSF